MLHENKYEGRKRNCKQKRTNKINKSTELLITDSLDNAAQGILIGLAAMVYERL